MTAGFPRPDCAVLRAILPLLTARIKCSVLHVTHLVTNVTPGDQLLVYWSIGHARAVRMPSRQPTSRSATGSIARSRAPVREDRTCSIQDPGARAVVRSSSTWHSPNGTFF
jgi:hypothetical protein